MANLLLSCIISVPKTILVQLIMTQTPNEKLKHQMCISNHQNNSAKAIFILKEVILIGNISLLVESYKIFYLCCAENISYTITFIVSVIRTFTGIMVLLI